MKKNKRKPEEEFKQHLGAFIIISVFLFLLNMFTSPSTWWFKFPVLGWSVGIAFHYLDVYGFPGMGKQTRYTDIQDQSEQPTKISGRLPMNTDLEEEDALILQKEVDKKWRDEDLV
ncbi:MAG: 2TM domain-containing protein [Saprospiraceae bacterium]|jgi:hypothetical protein